MGIVEWAMHYRQIVILVVTCLVAFGIYSLPNMQKNEFPDFTIRQGLVIAAAPGNTAQQMVDQVAKPLEDYIFTYKEVNKEKTETKCQDGLVVVKMELIDELTNKDEFWSKFKHGISEFKGQLPQNVLAVMVKDDFGDTSALLITMESDDKTYAELDDYMDELVDRFRTVESVGRMSVSGCLNDQISVYVDADRLAKYGINENILATTLMSKGFVTSGGTVHTGVTNESVYVAKSLNSVYDVEQQIVLTDGDGGAVRLGDVARVVREYPRATSYIENNGRKCLLLSVEMKKGKNMVHMGEELNAIITAYQDELPSDVKIYRITDQSVVVDDSVTNFLHELLIAICAVVLVVILLLPLRVALVAASTIPITIFISLGLFNAFGIELNTVSLAALIVTLGMIVDNSIVIIDAYLEKISEGQSRWHAAIDSTTHFFKSIFSATLAISITFFPFLITTTGMMHDFLLTFPWAITIVLGISLVVATLLVPFMMYFFIRKASRNAVKKNGEKAFSMLDFIQKHYNRLFDVCYRHPKITVGTGLAFTVLGAYLITTLPQKLLPFADRNQFAIEIFLPTGTPIEKTAAIADSVESILQKDSRIVSMAVFNGCASPRFHSAYAPQMGGENFAQFIVNTTGVKETVDVIDQYGPEMLNRFPEARVRFKQLSYNQPAYPYEVRLSGASVDSVRLASEIIREKIATMSEVTFVATDFNEPFPAVELRLKEDEASRLGLTNVSIEACLAMRYGSGLAVASVWEGDDKIPVVLKSERADSASHTDILNEPIPVAGGLTTVPLRQVADAVPVWKNGQLGRRNGVCTATVYGEHLRSANTIDVTKKIHKLIDDEPLPQGVTLTFGGEEEDGNEKLPPIYAGLIVAAAIIFFILVGHFQNIKIALLIFCSMALCVFGTAAGVLIQGVDFSVTCLLGVISLMGIIVRNGIIMIDYALELQTAGHSASEAIYLSAQRRMRPIFLTSAAAAMGVIPMILGGSGLWMPMGTVICYGTLITMVFILTVLPVAYLLLYRNGK